MERIKLDDAQIAGRLKDAVGWTVVEDKLSRTFEFRTYAQGVLFAIAVAHAADRMDHHPDLTIGYQRVTVAVNTHDVGGISPLDFALAATVDGLAPKG